MRVIFFLLLLENIAGLAIAQNNIQIQVTLNGPASGVTVQKNQLMYNKWGALSVQFDDRSSSAPAAAAAMRFNTDGCGNPVRYTAAIASNGVNRYYEDASSGGAMTLEQMKDLVVNYGWGIMDHGYIHGIDIWADQNWTVRQNVMQNVTYHYEKLKELGLQYVLRTGVVPTNDTGYHSVWKSLGFLGGTSEGTFDTFPPIPSAAWFNFGIGDITNHSGDYQAFARRFKDLINNDAFNDWFPALDALFSQASESNIKILNYGMHEATMPYFNQMLDHFEQGSNDKIWFVGMPELMDYIESKNKSIVDISYSGNLITITINQSALPNASRWRNLSLKLTSNAQIQSVSQTGADSIKFNPATGLINVFKMQHTFDQPFSNLPLQVLPVKFTSFSAIQRDDDIELKWSTENDENFSYYEIEKSIDGKKFNKIDSLTKTAYLDKLPEDVQFYRIKEVDKDGKHAYSTVLKVSRKNIRKATISYIKGNGARIDLLADKTYAAPIELYNDNGQLIYKTISQIRKGYNSLQIPDVMSSGTYTVKILDIVLRFIRS